MILCINKLIIHNFCSYGHSELDLKNRGFCLVSGENKYKPDNSLSNGSGKSTWVNAISACLTGQTLNGLHNNFKNINIAENSCYVTTEFSVDEDEYILTRIFNPKSDLKIIKNGTDISGKGISESKTILATELPKINKLLLSNCFLIGQGFPDKFSGLEPSKRKETLEVLTETDFMINDVKARVNKRQEIISANLRTTEDNLIKCSTNITNLSNEINSLTEIISKMCGENKPDFEKELKLNNELLAQNLSQKDIYSKKMSSIDEEITSVTGKHLKLVEAESYEKTSLNESYNKRVNELKTLDQEKYLNEINTLKTQITSIKNIKDTCPTCKQKLIHVHKPDTSSLEARLNTLSEERKHIDESLTKAKEHYLNYLEQIKNEYSTNIKECTTKLSDLSKDKQQLTSLINLIDKQNNSINKVISELTAKSASWDTQLASYNNALTKAKASLDKYTAEKAKLLSEFDELTEHTNTLKKMETLIKRDFRGILLQNVIKYLDSVAKIYSETVFKSNDLSIFLDGNNLDITFGGRYVEQLSGGERTKVDLIIQLAIRKMLNSYLNINSNILVLDEITDFLDAKSCSCIMELISQELNNTESVFIISHMADQLGLPIDSTITVVKDESGISNIQ